MNSAFIIRNCHQLLNIAVPITVVVNEQIKIIGWILIKPVTDFNGRKVVNKFWGRLLVRNLLFGDAIPSTRTLLPCGKG